MKKGFLILCFLICGLTVGFGSSVTLSELMKPAMVVAKNNRLYILEKTSIYIYSLKDYNLIKKFGREGEGPREFKARPFGPPMSMSFVGDTLVVNSNNKLSSFNLDGIFIKERKAPPNLVYYQIKNNFVGIGPSPDTENRLRISYRLFDNDFKELAHLYHTDVSVDPRDGFNLPLCAFSANPVYREKIVIPASSADFIIDIFDVTGKKMRRIKKGYVKKKITSSFKEKTLLWFKDESMYKQFYDSIKGSIRFRDYYPAIRDVKVTDDKIFIITHHRKGGLWECIIVNMEGEKPTRLFVPLSRYIPFTYYPLLYTVKNNKFYSLVEDEEEETWKLHVLKIR